MNGIGKRHPVKPSNNIYTSNFLKDSLQTIINVWGARVILARTNRNDSKL